VSCLLFIYSCTARVFVFLSSLCDKSFNKTSNIHSETEDDVLETGPWSLPDFVCAALQANNLFVDR
jgi:hypothetical protein